MVFAVRVVGSDAVGVSGRLLDVVSTDFDSPVAGASGSDWEVVCLVVGDASNSPDGASWDSLFSGARARWGSLVGGADGLKSAFCGAGVGFASGFWGAGAGWDSLFWGAGA